MTPRRFLLLPLLLTLLLLVPTPPALAGPRAEAEAVLERVVARLLRDLVGKDRATPEALASFRTGSLAAVPAEDLGSDAWLDYRLCHDLVTRAPERLREPHRLWPDPGGPGPIGRTRFDRILARWHRLPLDADDVLAIGRRVWAQTIEDLERVAFQIDPDRSWQAIARGMKDEHPEAGGIVEAYRGAVDEASRFCAEHDLVPLPSWVARLAVEPGEEKGVFPFARYESRIEDANYGGVLLATVPGADWSPGKREDLLRAQHTAWIRVVALHEAIPGHHLQRGIEFAQVPPLRRLAPSTVTVEGWGLYAERLMASAGYFRDPRQRLAQLQMSLWRAARVILDVGLHTRAVTPPEAVRMLVEEVGLEEVSARAEVKRFLDTPTQPMSYFVGCDQIERLRAACEAIEGEAFSLARFHERFLGYGSVPVSLIEDALTGRTGGWR